MKRLIANILVAAGGLTASSQLLALGLGELTLQSALNQPLRAEIELVDSKGLTEWEIKPALASQADFERAGVEREFFLTSITFKVEGNRIVLSSREPVNEPFLNFLVELNWPSGRVLREYTLLLDPPVFEETSYSPAVRAPAAVAETVELPAPVTPVAVNRWDSEPAAAGTYKVQKDDTLWDIALQTRPSAAITAQQMMIALQQQNPDAFIGGNINRLKSHQVLQIPDEQAIRAIAFNQAVAEVARQNRALQPGVAQVDATGRGGDVMPARADKQGGEVRLLSAGAEEAESAAASGEVAGGLGSDRQQALENDLAIALENVDKGRRENEELRKRLEALEEQINTLQRLISLKDDQLAGMQVPQQPAESASAEPAAAVDFNYSEAAADAPAADETAPLAAETETAETAEDIAAREAAEVQARRDRIAALIAEQEQQRPQPGLLDQLMANPLIPAAMVALLLLVILLVARVVKKSRAAKEQNDDADLSDDELSELQMVGANTADLDDFDFQDDDLQSSVAAADIQHEDEHPAEHFETVAQTEDVIGESDIYIAYGKFEHAVDLLTAAIDKEPSRTDLRLKLLEVYAEMDDARAFSQAEGELSSLGDRAAIEEAKVMRQRLSAPIVPAAAAAAAGLVAAPASLSLDDEIPDLEDEFADGMDFGDALDVTDQQADIVSLQTQPNVADDNVPALDLDDALDFDISDASEQSIDTAESPAPVAAADDDLLDFDLGDFADPQPQNNSVEEVSAAAGDDDLLEFDLGSLQDESSAAISVTEEAADVAAAVEALPEEDEFSFDFSESEVAGGNDAMDSLESLLDGDTSGSDELPDLSFDMEENTGFAVSDDDDLKALESELDVVTDTASVDQDLEDDLALLADEVAAEPAEADLTDGFNLDDVPALTDAADQFEETDFDVNAEEPVTAVNAVNADDEIDLDQLAAADDEFDFLAGTDECATKLDLARAYIDMEDFDGARELLQEVMQEGSDQQKSDARSLLSNMA